MVYMMVDEADTGTAETRKDFELQPSRRLCPPQR